MKNIFRAIGFGAALITFSAIGAFAQANPCDDEFDVKQAEYTKFRESIKGEVTIEKLETAVSVGTNFTTKYAACEDTAPVVKYINDKMPAVKETLIDMKRTKKFNDGVQKLNSTDISVQTLGLADAFSAGKEIVAVKSDKPISLDVALVLAKIGYNLVDAETPNDTYNSDTILMAETALKKIDTMVSTKYGAFGKYEFKTQKYPDGKQNAAGWMNYIIGYIKAQRQKNVKDSLPYMFKAATKYNSEVKTFPETFQYIGGYYVEELKKIDGKRKDVIKANGDKDNEESLAMWDLEKGYIDRSIDAYSRAHKLAVGFEMAATTADDKKAAKEYKDGLYGIIKALYEQRFDKKDGLDAHIAAQLSKPMPDPASEVQPVKEVAPTTTTSTTSTTSTTTTNSTTNTTKPTTNTTNSTTKPTTNTTKPTTTTKPSNTTTTPKKPATKKKSGR